MTQLQEPRKIIHKITKKVKYLCSRANRVIKGDFTAINGKVTCKNCLKILNYDKTQK